MTEEEREKVEGRVSVKKGRNEVEMEEKEYYSGAEGGEGITWCICLSVCPAVYLYHSYILLFFSLSSFFHISLNRSDEEVYSSLAQ